MCNLSEGVEAMDIKKGLAKGLERGIQIIKLYSKGMSKEDIASSLRLEMEYVEAAIASHEED